jgi:hypothetical protein
VDVDACADDIKYSGHGSCVDGAFDRQISNLNSAEDMLSRCDDTLENLLFGTEAVNAAVHAGLQAIDCCPSGRWWCFGPSTDPVLIEKAFERV